MSGDPTRMMQPDGRGGSPGGMSTSQRVAAGLIAALELDVVVNNPETIRLPPPLLAAG